MKNEIRFVKQVLVCGLILLLLVGTNAKAEEQVNYGMNNESPKQATSGWFFCGAVLGAATIGLYNLSTTENRKAHRDLDQIPKVLTWEGYDSYINSGRRHEASGERYKNAATLLGLVSAGFLTAGAISISVNRTAISIRKQVKF